jgi:alanine racemase
VNLQLTIGQLRNLFELNGSDQNDTFVINEVVYDTRTLSQGGGKLFFALTGKFRSGAAFIENAYQKGVRAFVVEKTPETTHLDAVYLQVNDALAALMKLAKWHRGQFNIPIVAIIGTHGKTTIKEWLGSLLKQKYRLVKSPKSYNSKLGVALSILELHSSADIGLFELSISLPDEGKVFNEMLAPTHVVIGHIGDKHNENFSGKDSKKMEYLNFTKGCSSVFQLASKIDDFWSGNKGVVKLLAADFQSWLNELGFLDQLKEDNAIMAMGVANFFDVEPNEDILFSDLVMRLETFDGIHGSLVINDTYSLDKESLEAALQYQSRLAKSKKRLLLLPKEVTLPKHEIEALLERYAPVNCHFTDELNLEEPSLSNAVVLVKGNAGSSMNKVAHQLKLKHHRTKINVNLSALRKNIHALKDLLPEQTKSLVMVKANAYGTGMKRTSMFIEQLGIDYLGVAYTDEGVQLRNYGVKCPILVMSPSSDDFRDCIEYNLEPAIFSLKLLDDFVSALILKKRTSFPMHLKIDSGMNRLGIKPSEIPSFIDILHSQPELYLKGVYSHFAESDNQFDTAFTKHQLDVFLDACGVLSKHISYPYIKHMANSAAIITEPNSVLDMVRMGLVVYGAADLKAKKQLEPVIEWRSEITQIKHLNKGDTVGYNREFIAEKETTIAIVPVGYADGFRRSLGKGKGSVFIAGKSCKTVGNVCMDMVMVDVTGLKLQDAEAVEIIGENQSILDFAAQLDTIPYEVLTALSLRVHRNYIVT